jgi:GABA permease
MLFVLAARREAPTRLLETNARGVPVAAILSSTAIGYLCVIAAYVSPDTVFLFLLNSSGAIILFVYLLIGISQLVMRPNISPEKLKVKMWGYPVLTVLTIVAMLAVLFSMGVSEDSRSQLFLSLLAFAVVLAAYWFQAKRRVAGIPLPAEPAPVMALHAVATALDASPLPLSASRVLVVANETVGAGELLGELRRLKNELTAKYLVCVPAHPLHTGQGAAWSPDASVIAAQHRLDMVLDILRGEGLQAEGVLGDYRPLHAMDDAVKSFEPDLIVISTHPEERSAWLRQDIVEQARHKYAMPVRHIISRVPVEIFGS